MFNSVCYLPLLFNYVQNLLTFFSPRCRPVQSLTDFWVLSGPVYLSDCWDSSCDSILIGPCDRQVITSTVRFLEEERGAAAADAAVRDDGDTVAQNIRFIHVMRRQNDGTTCKRHRHQTNARSALVGAPNPSKFSSERGFLKGSFSFEWDRTRLKCRCTGKQHALYIDTFISHSFAACIEKFPVFCIRRSSRRSQTPAGFSAAIISALPLWRGSGSSRRLSFDLPRAEIWNITHLRFPKADAKPARETRVYIERRWCRTL